MLCRVSLLFFFFFWLISARLFSCKCLVLDTSDISINASESHTGSTSFSERLHKGASSSQMFTICSSDYRENGLGGICCCICFKGNKSKKVFSMLATILAVVRSSAACYLPKGRNIYACIRSIID